MSPDTPTWVAELMADNRATRAAVEKTRDHVDNLHAGAEEEHRKIWIAIRGLKAALKHKPSKFVLLSNSKLAIALVGALIPASVSVYALHTARSAATDVQQAAPVAAATCEATKQLTEQRLVSLDRNLQLVLDDKNKTPGQKAYARKFYIQAVNATPDVKC